MHTLVRRSETRARRENRERDGDESETDRDSKRGAVRASLSCRVELVRERETVCDESLLLGGESQSRVCAMRELMR